MLTSVWIKFMFTQKKLSSCTSMSAICCISPLPLKVGLRPPRQQWTWLSTFSGFLGYVWSHYRSLQGWVQFCSTSLKLVLWPEYLPCWHIWLVKQLQWHHSRYDTLWVSHWWASVRRFCIPWPCWQLLSFLTSWSNNKEIPHRSYHLLQVCELFLSLYIGLRNGSSCHMLPKHMPTQNSGLYLCNVFFNSIYTAYQFRVSGHYQVSGRHIFDLFALISSHMNLALVSSAFSIEVYEHLLRKAEPPGYANPLLQFQGRDQCLRRSCLQRRVPPHPKTNATKDEGAHS